MGKSVTSIGLISVLTLVIVMGGGISYYWMYGLIFENLQIQIPKGLLQSKAMALNEPALHSNSRDMPTLDYVFPIVAMGKDDGTCNCTFHAVSAGVACTCEMGSNRSTCGSISASPDSMLVKKKTAEEVQVQPWYARNRTWHYPALFPRCSMDVCFNYTRCANQSELLIYSYAIPSPPVRYFALLNSSVWHTDDPDKACLFFVFLDSPTNRKHPSSLPYWEGNGLNHVLVTFTDMWRQRGPPPQSIGFASILASDMHETVYRPGFDISITLNGRVHLTALQAVPPVGRPYLVTFRGLRYLGHPTEEGVLRSYDSFRSMHNGKDVIVVTTCKQATNDLKRRKEPELGRHCEEDEAEHARYNFHGLMNTTFGLVPAGRSPNSYRLVEVIAAGIVPVLIADNYVKPFDTLIQWHRCILQFPSSQMHLIVRTLRAMVGRTGNNQNELLQRQRYCIHIYNHFLRDDPTLLRATIASLKARLYGAVPFMPTTVDD